MNYKLVTCEACGWVHMGVSRLYAEDSVARFNEFFEALPKDQKEDYYNDVGSNIEDYEKCFRCGGSYKNFREAKDEDCPEGCTLNPIINKED